MCNIENPERPVSKRAGTDNSSEMFLSPQSLEYSSCDFFTDEVFTRRHQFRNLQSLIVSDCRSISKKVIDFIFSQINPLSFLSIHVIPLSIHASPLKKCSFAVILCGCLFLLSNAGRWEGKTSRLYY